MLKSMTGYGSSEMVDELCSQIWEIKSVNSKQFNLRWKLPNFLSPLEQDWERTVRQYAQRGRIDISLTIQIYRTENYPLHLNRPLAKTMLDQLRAMAKAQGEPFYPDYNGLLNIPFIWQENSVNEQAELGSTLFSGLKEALEKWDQSRIKEGQSLKEDLVLRCQRMQKWLSELEKESQGRVEEKFEQFKSRIKNLYPEVASETDNDRLWQELAILADKLDISEELTRLETHFSTLDQLLRTEETSGRNLDFLFQECFREINTCGNKAQDTGVSKLVVDLKTELEKCREQIQNLE